MLYDMTADDAMHMLEILCEELSRCGLTLTANKPKVSTNNPGPAMAADTLTVPFGEQRIPAIIDTDAHNYFFNRTTLRTTS